MAQFPKAMEDLIRELSNLPTIGRKSARRLAFKIIDMDNSQVEKLADALISVKKNIKHCEQCGNLSDEEFCVICSDEGRDKSIITVVEDSSNIPAIEKSREYRGLYHVLGGVISPRDNITPEDLNIEKLVERAKKPETKEIILALSPTVDGDMTANILANILKGADVKVTQISKGIPVGASLEFYDEMSIYNAMRNRREM
ncbi:MAG: recombination protein RecR [Tissierellia bacterium]|nr:recombination protein RecR [Tissierellia bacterium]